MSSNENPHDERPAGQPSFICVGSQRAGTTFLYRMLRQHPQIWLPPIKELHFFDKPLDRPYRRNEILSAKTRQGQRDSRFVERLRKAIAEGDQSIRRYKSLFRPAGRKFAGDITPGYSTLPSETVEDLAWGLPQTRVLLILRDPLSRLWSHASMVQRKQSETKPLTSFDTFRAFCEDPAVEARTFQSSVYERWSAHFGNRLHLLFFDDLVADSQEFVQHTHRIIGVEPQSIKLNRERAIAATPEMPSDMRSYAGTMLAGEYKRLADLVGGHAAGWADRAQGESRAVA